MGYFFFRRFLSAHLNSFPEEPVEYTPTLKQGPKTNSGEQTCYLGLDRRPKPPASQTLTDYNPIHHLLLNMLPSSRSSPEDPPYPPPTYPPRGPPPPPQRYP